MLTFRKQQSKTYFLFKKNLTLPLKQEIKYEKIRIHALAQLFYNFFHHTTPTNLSALINAACMASNKYLNPIYILFILNTFIRYYYAIVIGKYLDNQKSTEGVSVTQKAAC